MEKKGASGANRHNCRMTTAMLCCKPWTSNISNVLLLEELRTDSLIGFLRAQHQLACSSDSRSSPTPWYLQIRPKIASLQSFGLRKLKDNDCDIAPRCLQKWIQMCALKYVFIIIIIHSTTKLLQ
jgi:hypothetical protein